MSDSAIVVSASRFEYAVEQFIEQVRGLLRAGKVAQSNLDRIWNEVLSERRDSATSKRRKLEALLGHDPDEASEQEIETLMKSASAFGDPAMNELAADHAQGGDLPTVEFLHQVAASAGFEASFQDAVQLPPQTGLSSSGEVAVAAWEFGSTAARALREQEGLGAGPIGNGTLAKLAAVQAKALTKKKPGPLISFALAYGPSSRLVLRSKWETGRRFELVRLLGDHLTHPSWPLLLATRSYTYRQKMQRAFAAELLSPFDSIEDRLSGDYSMEKRQDIAEEFKVSEWTIHTLLLNHRRLERVYFVEDFDVAVA